MSLVTYQDDNNQQVCAYFFFLRHIHAKLPYPQLALPGGHHKEVGLTCE